MIAGLKFFPVSDIGHESSQTFSYASISLGKHDIFTEPQPVNAELVQHVVAKTTNLSFSSCSLDWAQAKRMPVVTTKWTLFFSQLVFSASKLCAHHLVSHSRCCPTVADVDHRRWCHRKLRCITLLIFPFLLDWNRHVFLKPQTPKPIFYGFNSHFALSLTDKIQMANNHVLILFSFIFILMF